MRRPTRALLDKKIDAFLKDFVKITDGRETAKASELDMTMAYAIVDHLLALKFERSYKGAVPIEVTLVNRTTHHRLHYQPEPYDGGLNIAIMNVGIAVEKLPKRIYRNDPSLTDDPYDADGKLKKKGG